MTKFDHLAERGPLRKYAAAINDLIEEVRSLRIASGKGYTVKRTSIGTILEVKGGTQTTITQSDLEIRRFQVTEIKPHYLICYTVRSDGLDFESTSAIKVLKPYCTLYDDTSCAWDGCTITTTDTAKEITRTLVKQDPVRALNFTFTQAIFPAWIESTTIGLGDWIFAAKNIDGFSARDGETPSNAVEWLDLNVDARHWAFSGSQQVAVCVDGVTKWMRFIASSIGESP